MNKIKLVFMVILTLLFFFICGGATAEVMCLYVDEEMTYDDIVFLFLTYAGFGVAVWEIIRIIKQKKCIFFHMLGVDVAICLILFCFQGLLIKDSDLILGTVFLLAVLAGIVGIIQYDMKSKKAAKLKENSESLKAYQFFGFKAKWLWDEIEEEYKQQVGYDETTKTYENFLEEHADTIYIYCCTYIAYLFAWLVKHNGIENDYLAEMKVTFEGILCEEENPAEKIYYEMDGALMRADISDTMLGFLDDYYEAIPNSIKPCYQSDYEDIVQSSCGDRHCVDFSWNLYHTFEKVLDERYDTYMRSACLEDLYEEDWFVYEEYSEYFRQNFSVLYQPVSESEQSDFDIYAEKCVEHFQNLPDTIIMDLINRLTHMDYFEHIAKDELISQIKDMSLIIFKPFGKELAYVIGFEADFEPEHGISVMIRDGRILDVGFRNDYETPWAKEYEE